MKARLTGLGLLVALTAAGIGYAALSRPYSGGELSWSTAERWGWYGLGAMAVISVAVVLLNPYSALYQDLRFPWPGNRGVEPVEKDMVRDQKVRDRIANMEAEDLRRRTASHQWINDL
jgi:hypothetical protein